MGTFSIRTQTFRLDGAAYQALSLSPRHLAPVAGICLGIGLAYGLLHPPGADIRTWPYFGAMTLCSAFVYFAAAQFLLRLYYRHNATTTGERIMILDDGAVRLTGNGFDIRQAWGAFNGVAQGRNHIFLFMRGAKAYVIPKRALPAPGDAQRLVTCAHGAIRAAAGQPSMLSPIVEPPDNRELWSSHTRGRDGGGLVFTRDYVRHTTPMIDNRIDWDNIRNVVRTRRAFVIRTPNDRFSVPVSAFAGPAQAEAFFTQAVAFWRAAQARRELHS